MVQDKYKWDWHTLRVAMKRIAQRHGYPYDQAEDLVQQACLRIVRADPTLGMDMATVAAYAATTMKHVIVDDIRQRGAQPFPRPSPASPDTLAATADISERAIREHLHLALALRTALAALDPTDVETIREVSSKRGGAAALARRRGIHRATVARHFRRALRALQTELAAMCTRDPKLAEILEEHDAI